MYFFFFCFFFCFRDRERKKKKKSQNRIALLQPSNAVAKKKNTASLSLFQEGGRQHQQIAGTCNGSPSVIARFAAKVQKRRVRPGKMVTLAPDQDFEKLTIESGRRFFILIEKCHVTIRSTGDHLDSDWSIDLRQSGYSDNRLDCSSQTKCWWVKRHEFVSLFKI